MPAVEQRLRICPGRENHTIAGLSMGGYGAFYLAAQRPDYFGTAGSFSGVIAISRSEFGFGFPDFARVWGPVGGDYALAHDPAKLLPNLRSTRLFVGVGDGQPFDGGERAEPQLHIAEVELKLMAEDFVRGARAAGMRPRYVPHRGQHSAVNFFDSLRRMRAWGLFGATTQSPRSWTMRTIARHGRAWGYRYAFAAAPRRTVTFAYARGRLRALGTGVVTIRAATGRAVTARLPFALSRGRVTRLRGGSDAGPGRTRLLFLHVTPKRATRSSRLAVRWTTDRRLPKGHVYQVVVSQQVKGCSLIAGARGSEGRKGRPALVPIRPGAGPGHARNRWCAGRARVALMIVPRSARQVQPGAFVGSAPITIHRTGRKG